MPFLFQYLIKFSLSLAVLYTFYFVVLRPLTFYQWNRFYLLCYALLSFIIPFINITDWLTGKNIESNLINSIPAVNKFTSHSFGADLGTKSFLHALLSWNLASLLFLSGALIMLTRIGYQYLSLRAMKRKAVLLRTGDFEFYDVNGPITPFSFANAIFINSRLHTEDEFHRILEHEFVHVKQHHTIDIVVAELICIFNWYNPFAWLIRKAIRQNLEFIADKNVLEGGIDPRQYQYLLLKVMGLPQFSITNNFSFSSLKKRITMMNKMKTARVHLVKFLFILPLLSLVLLAFRDRMNFDKDGMMFTYAGIVVNSANNQPLKNVVVKELNTNLQLQTDENGYFKLRIPAKNDHVSFRIRILKDGNLKKELTVNWVKFAPQGSESFIGLIGINNETSGTVKCDACFDYQNQVIDNKGLFAKDVSYETVNKSLHSYLEFKNDLHIIDQTDKPIIRIANKLYVFAGIFPGKADFQNGYPTSFTLMNTDKNPVIYLNGDQSDIGKVNATVNRIAIKQIEHFTKGTALEKYGVNAELVNIITYSGIGSDTIPRVPVPPAPPAKAEIQTLTAAPIPATPVPPGPTVAVPVPPAMAPVPKLKPVTVTVARLTYSPNEITDKKITIVNVTPVAAVDTNPASRLVNAINIRGGEPLYIIDGEQQQAENFKSLDPKSISSIEVVKDASAIALYGDKAKAGVIIINTKAKLSGKPAPDDSISVTASKIYINKLDDIKGLIIVNGEEVSKQQLADIKGESIKSITVLKNGAATSLYGEKGKDGVIVITLKQ